ERLGQYAVSNVWTVGDLCAAATGDEPAIASWRQLVESARLRFSNLTITDDVYENPNLLREPFEGSIRDRTMALLGHLDAYMAGRSPEGVEGPDARKIVDDYFVGDRALFSGESRTNQEAFRSDLTFPDPDNSESKIFAHWHGKISHRYFRLHFEWPVP